VNQSLKIWKRILQPFLLKRIPRILPIKFAQFVPVIARKKRRKRKSCNKEFPNENASQT
jgi:hypothetical protein